MKKIPSLFVRNMETKLMEDKVTPGCEWVVEGHGVATRKWDGTSVMIKDGAMFKRRTVRKGKNAPDDFILCTHDENTGKSFGWVPVDKDDKWHLEVFSKWNEPRDGTYELIGKKIQGGAEEPFAGLHTCIMHGSGKKLDCPRTFDEIREWLRPLDIEGIVFHSDEYGMAKVKKSDFGMRRNPE